MKTKRTYNLSSDTVATVKRLVEDEHRAPSQDALVEQAIREYARLLRDAADAQLWARAANDPNFQEEAVVIDAEFAEDDLQAWNA